MKYSAVFFVFLSAFLCAQNYIIQGRVSDMKTGEALPYATIRLAGQNKGTTTNAHGNFELKLNQGNYTLISSFMGYKSDTIKISVRNKTTNIEFKLDPTQVHLPPITILPGENPAAAIIKKAIERKHERGKILKTYEFSAFTKAVIKAQQKILDNEGGGLSLIYSGPDTSALKIAGIFENQSKTYRKGDLKKDEITARKQTANLPAYVNILTGGRLVEDFYQDEIQIIGSPIIGPLAEKSYDYYYFHIIDTLAQDNRPVFKISMTPFDSLDPGFVGYVFITADTYDLLKIDTRVNKAADKNGLTDSLKIFQQFLSFGNENVSMPVDYRLDVALNLLGLMKVGIDFNSIMYEYAINPDLPDALFTNAIITVRTDADKKDSTFWAGIQTLPVTTEESAAYHDIDSVAKKPVSIWEKFSFLSGDWSLSDKFSVSAPLGMYNFNRVEGHSAMIEFNGHNLFDERFRFNTSYRYGFSDKKWKGDAYAKYLFGDYRTMYIEGSIYKKLRVLMNDANVAGDFIGSLVTLLSKHEDNNYFYSEGFNMQAGGDVFPVLALKAGFANHTDKSSVKNTEISILRPKDKYNSNDPVNDVRVNEIELGFSIDFRPYIEDGMYRRRTGGNNSFIRLSGSYSIAGKSFGSELDYSRFQAKIDGVVKSFGSTRLNYKLSGSYGVHAMPLQSLTSVSGNWDGLFRELSFRTLQFNEVFGDRVAECNLEYDFGDAIFRATGIQLLKKSALNLSCFANAAVSSLSNESKRYSVKSSREFLSPFYEAGFGIYSSKMPMTFEFGWKLNYFGSNNFRFGIKSVF